MLPSASRPTVPGKRSLFFRASKRYLASIAGIVLLFLFICVELAPTNALAVAARSHTVATVNEGCNRFTFSADGNPFPLCPGPYPTGGNCVWWAWEQWHLLGYDLPLNWGNAADWVVDAESSGLPLGTTPRVGSIAVFPHADGVWAFGAAGHVAFVTAVSADGSTFDVTYQNYGDPNPMYVGTGYNASLINEPQFQNGNLRFIYFPRPIDPQRFADLPGIGNNDPAAIANANNQLAHGSSSIGSNSNVSSAGAVQTLTNDRLALGLSPVSSQQEFNADFTGTGYSDLLLYDRQQGQLHVLELTHPQSVSLPQSVNAIHTVPHAGYNLMNPTAPLDSLPRYVNLGDAITPAGKWGSALSIQIGDFQGTGKSDILLYDRTAGTIQLLSLTPQLTIEKHVTLSGWGPGWELYVGRFDGKRSGLFMYNRFSSQDPSVFTDSNPTPAPVGNPTGVTPEPPGSTSTPGSTPTGTPKPSPTPTSTPKPTATPTHPPVPTVAPTPKPTPPPQPPTATPTPKPTPTPVPTATPTPKPTPTPPPAPTAAPTTSPTGSPGTGSTATCPTATSTATPGATATPCTASTTTGTTNSTAAAVSNLTTSAVPEMSKLTSSVASALSGMDGMAATATPPPDVSNTDASGNSPADWATKGRTANIVTLDFDKNFTVLHQQQYTTWHSSWEIYVGHFATGNRDGVFLYDRVAGEGRMLDFDNNMAVQDFQGLHNLNGNWVVTSGDFNGSGRAQVLLYDPSSGDAQFLTFNKNLALANQVTQSSWGTNMVLYAGHFGTSALSVMLYDPQAGESTFIAFDSSLQIAHQYTVKSWDQHWQVLVGAFIDRSHCVTNGNCTSGDDILVLNRDTGQLEQYVFSFGRKFQVYDNRIQAFVRDGVVSDNHLNAVDTTTFNLMTTLKTNIRNEELY
ncbi:MAG: CHAP domain-containing protein [Ktedonobacteraceae bacterium]|nr:CHAP domain-containing protein [Ktedonobacteraceae bacterium]